MKKRYWVILIVILAVLFLVLFAKITGRTVIGTAINTCSDTDLGKKYWKKGSVSGEYTFLTTEHFFEKDYCKNEKTLIEYYCIRENEVNSYKESQEYLCEEKCEDGKCLGLAVEIPNKKSFWDKLKEFLRV